MLSLDRTAPAPVLPALLHLVVRALAIFDPALRRRRRVEQDLLALSPYLQRDLGFWRE